MSRSATAHASLMLLVACRSTGSVDAAPPDAALGGRGRLEADGGDVHFAFDAKVFILSSMLVSASHRCEAPFAHAYSLPPRSEVDGFVRVAGTATSREEAAQAKASCYAPGPHMDFNAAIWCCSF